MALSDLVLKAKVNAALARDIRARMLDVGVDVADGVVTLNGAADSLRECRVAVEVVAQVEGIGPIRNSMTCGTGRKAESAESIVDHFLEKLQSEWDLLPERNALAQADYIRWGCWLTYKFHIPAMLDGAGRADLEAEAVERALVKIADLTGTSKAMIALELLNQAERIGSASREEAPESYDAPLIATPMADEDRLAA